MHGVSCYWWQSDATANANGYHIPSLLCFVVQLRDTVHLLDSSFSLHLPPERVREGVEMRGPKEREKGEKQKGKEREKRHEGESGCMRKVRNRGKRKY